MTHISRSCNPRLSTKQVSSIIGFKDYFVKQSKEQSKRHSQFSMTNQSPSSNPKRIQQKMKIQKEMDEYNKKNKDDSRKKQLFEEKYNSFVDRIYGKITRERRDLDHIMNNFRLIQNQDKDNNETRFMNHQELLILDQIKGSQEKQRTDNILLSRIARDFKKEMSKDMEIHLNHQQQQQQVKNFSSDQPLDSTFYKMLKIMPHGELKIKSPQAQLTAQFKRVPSALIKSEIKQDIYSTITTPIVSPTHIKSSSLILAKQMISQRKEKQVQIQQHLEYEKHYLKEPFPIYDEHKEENQFIDDNKYFAQKVTKLKHTKKTMSQSYKKLNSQQTNFTKDQSTDNSLDNVKQKLLSLGDALKLQNNDSRTILKLCQRERKYFGSKYSKIKISLNNVAG